MGRIASAWTRIEQWLAQNAPEVAANIRPAADPALWREFERTWGRAPLDALRELYGLHDGGEAAIAGDDWYSLSEAIRVHDIWSGLTPSFPAAPTRWFPFAGYGRLAYVVDLATGAVLKSDGVDNAVPVAATLEDFFDLYARDLDLGRYRVDAADGISHVDFEGPGRIGETRDLTDTTPLSERLDALLQLQRDLAPGDLAVLNQAPVQDLVSALHQTSAAHRPGGLPRAAALVAKVLGPRGAAWAREQLNVSELGSARFEIARHCLSPDEAVEWAWEQPRVLGGDIEAFGRLASPKLLDKLEAHQGELESRVEWGRVAYDCGLDWPRARRWLSANDTLRRIALDALAWPYGVEPRETPIAVPPKELRAALAEVVVRDPSPRCKRAVRVILGETR